MLERIIETIALHAKLDSSLITEETNIHKMEGNYVNGKRVCKTF